MDERFVNLVEEVISSTSESATVCFVISLSICYWLFNCGVLCVVCVCVCAWERDRERISAAVPCMCVCARVCERGRQGHTTTACVQTHTSFITVSVTWFCSPLGLELMVKLRTLLNVIMERGVTFLTRACGVQPITMHWVSWTIRADCAFWKEGLCRKRTYSVTPNT